MQDLFIEFLPPWVETGLQPAFYDRESGTILQQVSRMYAKMNEIIKSVNGMDKIIKEYVDYIDNYFKNLDVQEEINNKLDEMAEDGTLDEIINQNIFNELDGKIDGVDDRVDGVVADVDDLQDYQETEEAKNAPFTYNYLYSAEEGFGNCLVIKGDKNIIVDLGDRDGVVLPWLIANNVTKIDAIVLTHYHSDHTGGLNGEGLAELINSDSIDLTDCTVYLPHKGIDWTLVTGSQTPYNQGTENAIKSMLTTANIGYYEPDNAEIVTLTPLTKLQFFNIGSSFYSHYYGKNDYGKTADSTDYNSFSMLVKITHNDISEFESADITSLAQKYNAQYLTDVKIYHAFHHGSMTYQDKAWALKLNPDYCIITKRYIDIPADNTDIETCGAKKATIYDVKEAGHTISIVQKGNMLNCSSDFACNKYNMAVTTRPTAILESGTDLNDVLDDGSYFCPTDAWARTMSNLPPCVSADPSVAGNLSAFRLDVTKKYNIGSDRVVKQSLYYVNKGAPFLGEWYREIRGLEGGYSAEFTDWQYVRPCLSVGNQSFTNLYGLGYISGDGKTLYMGCPYAESIPYQLKMVNGAMTRCLIKGIDGTVAQADTDAQAQNYVLSDMAKGASGINIIVRKADGTTFGTANTPVTGTITLTFTLEAY